MFEKIMVTLDGSRFSGRALPYAIEIANKFKGEVVLFQAVPATPLIVPSATSDGVGISATSQLLIESTKAQDNANVAKARSYLRKKVRELDRHGIKGTYAVELGDPAASIISFCKKNSIKLVVMTTRGKGGLKRAILGSVADKIVREPGIPVLAIRPEEQRKKK